MRKTAELAEPRRGLFELHTGEGIGVGAVGADAEPVEKGLADQMRRLAGHRADAEIDAGLAEKHRPQLRMGIRDVQDARIAEALDVVDAVGAAREPRQRAGEGGGTRKRDEIPGGGCSCACLPRDAEITQLADFQVLPELFL